MASENVSKTVSLKDYIIDMQSAAVKGSAQYEVVLENNTDFIIKRRTATTDRELVILVSKGLYYIKDCKTGHIEELKEQSLNTFLRELKDGMVALHEVHWLSNLYRESVGLIMQVITDETLTDMCRHNVLVNTFDPTWYTRYWKQNSKLFIRLYNMFPSMADRKKYQASIPVIFWIEEQYGANEAMFFAEKLVQSGIMELDFNQNGYSYYGHQTSHDPGWFLNVMASPHRVNLRRFIDYILFDLYAQGYASVTKSFFVEYLDYLEMQQKFYGKVKEKYPTHFKTEHDIMALKVNQARLLAKCEDFEQQNESIKDLAYSGSGYCIVVPTKPEELAEEGINLSHCVGQYIDRVAGGDCHILFLRRRGAPDRSLVTLQLSGKQICQAQGFNRRPITDQERRFLVQWGREKDIQIAV